MGSVKKGFAMMVSSLPLVALFFVYGLVTNFVNNQFATRLQNNTNVPLFAVSVAVSIVFVVLGLFFQAGSMTYFKEKASGGKADMAVFMAGGQKYFVQFLLFALIIMAIVGTAAAGSVAITQATQQAIGIAATFLLVGVALFFIVIWFLAPYAIVVDGKKLRDAMATSVSVVKKNLGLLALIGFLLIAIGFVSGFVFGLLSGLIGAIVNKGAVDPNNPVPQNVLTFFGSLVNSFLGILMTATFMDFYLTRRERA